MTKKLIFALLIFCLTLPGTSHATNIKLGFINSITGPEAPIGENQTNGVTFAIEDLKKMGIDVELVKEDDAGKPDKSLAAFEKLATRDNVTGIVGPYTSATANADAKMAERYKVPLIVPAASKEEITQQGYKWTYRVSGTTSDYAGVLFDLATALGKPKTVAILNENTDFGVSGAKSAKTIAAQKGIKVVFEEAYSKGSPDYRSTLAKVKSANPDLVFMVSYVADAILLMRQSREIGLTPMAFLGAGAGFSVVQFAKEKEISQGVFSSTQWSEDAPWPGSKAWYKRYEKQFGKPPTYHAACAYESMMIMGQAVAAAGGDREKTRETLHTGKWNGILGEVRFQDYEGYQNQRKAVMLVEQVQNGKHETVWPLNDADTKPIWPFPGWTK
ncbi:MAG TPA: ABC transporter substrate-binding protein [Nitrospirota bacterium]|nr:ABC transporter substrate-binding protein [Nitrospirota bacterium]